MNNTNTTSHTSSSQSSNQKKQTVTKAMILAAGFGTRMRPLTLTTPKPLLPVYKVPLIIWHILSIKAAGITDIVINVAWLAKQLIDALGDGSQFGVRLSFSRELEALETAGGIQKALPLLGEQAFLLVNGDVWTTANYANIIHRACTQDASAYLCLVDNPEHNPLGDFVIHNDSANTKHGSAVICAKTDPQEQGKTFAGISVLKPTLFSHLPAGKAPLAPILVDAMHKNNCVGELLSAQWVDVGTPQRLSDLDEYINTHGAPEHPAWSYVLAYRDSNQ